jgi:hypothetical protein
MDYRYIDKIGSLNSPSTALINKNLIQNRMLQRFNMSVDEPIKQKVGINSVDVKYQNNRGIGQLIHGR